MKIYTNQESFDKFVGKDLWVLVQVGMNQYWIKLLSKTSSTTFFGNAEISTYHYCAIMAWDDDVYDPDDVLICDDDLRGYKPVYPLTVLSTEELFGENADLWWEDRNI